MDAWGKWELEKRERRERHEKTLRAREAHTSILTLERRFFTDKSTIGFLSIDNEFLCHTLEDTARDPNHNFKLDASEKIAGETAIPAGQYEIVISYSNKFKKKLPLLLNVPLFKGVRIHSGNRPEHTAGCVLTGKYDKEIPDRIADSRVAFNKVMGRIEETLNLRKLYIVINGGPES